MVEQYVEDGMLFMAMKLSADQDVDALKPIVMTYEGSNPVIPIRLTAVAADPHMGVIVWLLGEGRAVSANYSNIELDASRIRFDASLQSNYRTLVTQQVDEAGGHAFTTEFADLTENVFLFDEEAQALAEQYQWVTRLYTTISPEEMTIDPTFTFNPNLPAVSNFINLSEYDEICVETAGPCDFTHCGPDATCYEVNGAAACECADGFVARGITDPTRGASVTCVPETSDMISDAIDADPCAMFTCGEFGSCVAINGRATCACDGGYVATSGPDGSVLCEDVELAELPDGSGPTTGSGPNDGTPAGNESSGCSVVGGAHAPASLLLVLGLSLIGIVRRR